MYLKSLVLKGFKSFADTTEINFEPGVTVVVGPNGSGKSNIVDAVAWVLGAQGPSIVRSSKMDDVIFAGNASQAALGRAEVILTIDNSARRLPIDLSEVTISRVLFRNGDSEYFINGAPCRLLDIQELLSDTGVGKSQHVIISQGQIDAILTAKPEDRRAVIEEAAGVLKYRRRKEKAERRLLASQTNLDRVQDMMREVKRQIGPLKKQALAAIRYSEISDELYKLKLFQSGQELKNLQNLLHGSFEMEASLKLVESELERKIGEALEKESLNQQKLIRGQDTDLTAKVSTLNSLKEKTKGLTAVIVERRRLYESKRTQVLDEQVVNSLEAEATELTKNLEELSAERIKLAPMANEIETTETHLASLKVSYEELFGESESGSGDNPNSKFNESKAMLEGLHKANISTERFLSQLHQNQQSADQNFKALTGEQEAINESLGEINASLNKMESEKSEIELLLNSNLIELKSVRSAKESIEDKLKAAQIDRGTLENALSTAMSESGATELMGQSEVIGVFGDLILIEPGYEKAVTAAIGPLLTRAVAKNATSAFDILKEFSSNNRSPIVIPSLDFKGVGDQISSYGEQSHKVKKLADCLKVTQSDHKGFIQGLLEGYFVYDGDEFGEDFIDSVKKMLAEKNAVIVSKRGDRFSRDGWYLKSDSAVIVTATSEALNKATKNCETLNNDLTNLVDSIYKLQAIHDQYETALKEKNFEINKLSFEIVAKENQLSRLKRDLEASQLQKLNIELKIQEQSTKFNEEIEQINTIKDQLEQLRQASEEYVSRMNQKRELSDKLSEIQYLLNQKVNQFQKLEATLSERKANFQNRLNEIEKRLEGKEEQRSQAKKLLEAIEIQSQGLASLQEMANRTQKLIDSELVVLNVHIQTNQQALQEASQELEFARKNRGEFDRELLQSRDMIQKQQIVQAETKVKLEHIRDFILNDIDSTLEEADACQEPVLPPGITYRERIYSLEKEMKSLGPVNALADTELEELEQRYLYLAEQLEDIRKARRELSSLIRSIDEEISHEFESAFIDVKSNYKSLLEVLFPGGSGDLILTDTEHLLETGIEIEARPAGRTVKKLSLLSGGERSLVAMAFLFAVFRSRPSPFYLMDEVEAALDDLNLARFLNLINEFRTTAQLIIVSHQKRTMENADALYGVSMQPGGSTKVVSEKLASSRQS